MKIVEFKYAQGAKPGPGGHLLGDKNTPAVAKMREAVAGVSLFSPFPFHSVSSIEDHKKHVDWILAMNPDALVSSKVSTPNDVAMVAVGSYYAGSHIMHIDGTTAALVTQHGSHTHLTSPGDSRGRRSRRQGRKFNSMIDMVATGSYHYSMRAVGIKVLKNRLSEYVRLASRGETVLVTDRDRVVAELVPPSGGRSPQLQDALLAEAVRSGAITAPAMRTGEPPARAPRLKLARILLDLERDRTER